MIKQASLLIGLLFAIACQPAAILHTDGSDTDGSDTGSTSTNTGDGDGDGDDGSTAPEGTSVLLHVVTADGDGISKAKISVDGEAHFTDAAGFIQFENLDGDRFHARVDAPGFTSGAVAIDLAEGLNAYQEIKLFPFGDPLPLDAELGGTVEHDGVAVEIPPNAIVNRFGEFVTGTVDVTIVAVDPSQPDELTALPGPLEARSDLDEDVLLLTLGMAEISLWQDGESLQLAPGATAMLHFDIPDELADSLEPGTPIPAWSLDLDEGVWVQESMGLVETDGDQKIWSAEVDHFTWYNCDLPVGYENLDCYIITFVDQDDNAFISNREFSMTAKADVDGVPGFFADGGHSSATYANVISNCVIAPTGSDVTLTVEAQPNLVPALPDPIGEGGYCRIGGMPNSECTPVTIKLPPDVICNNGSTKLCPYSGPPEKLGVGICQIGKDKCVEGGTKWTGCEGEITPEEFESCKTDFDDNCNGQLNEVDAIDCNCSPMDTIPCYTGPAGVVFGAPSICTTGTRACNPDPLIHDFLDECVGQTIPGEELDETPDIDEDCDGMTVGCECVYGGVGGGWPPLQTCGNGLVDDGEECDGGNLGGYTCLDLGYMPGGDLGCTIDSCRFDTTGCIVECNGPTCNESSYCQSDADCEQGHCYVSMFPLPGNVCGECASDLDCLAGGRTPPNPWMFADEQSTSCNMGLLGDACQSSDACQDSLVCSLVLDDGGGLWPELLTCGECSMDADCMNGQICVANADYFGYSGAKICMAPLSLPLDSFCELDGNGDQACASGICDAIVLMGFLQSGACGECESDLDCGGGQCVGGVLDSQTDTYTGSRCI